MEQMNIRMNGMNTVEKLKKKNSSKLVLKVKKKKMVGCGWVVFFRSHLELNSVTRF